MAVLTDPQRFACWAEFMNSFGAETISITKVDLRAALNAVDQWVSDNASAYNLAIPQPARSALTAAQKARMLTIVAKWRFDNGTV